METDYWLISLVLQALPLVSVLFISRYPEYRLALTRSDQGARFSNFHFFDYGTGYRIDFQGNMEYDTGYGIDVQKDLENGRVDGIDIQKDLENGRVDGIEVR